MIGTCSIAFGQGSKNSTTAPKVSKSSKGSKSSSSSSKSSSGSSSKSNSSKVNKSFANAHKNKNINSTSIFPSQESSGSSNSLFPKASSNSNNSALTFSNSGSSGASKLSSLMGSKNMFSSDLKESKSSWNWQATESEKPENYIRYRRPPINSPYYQSKASFTYSGNIRTEKSKGQISQKLKIAKHFTDKAAVKPNRQYDPATYYMGQ
jgi:hypothetical protein